MHPLLMMHSVPAEALRGRISSTRRRRKDGTLSLKDADEKGDAQTFFLVPARAQQVLTTMVMVVVCVLLLISLMTTRRPAMMALTAITIHLSPTTDCRILFDFDRTHFREDELQWELALLRVGEKKEEERRKEWY
ncbi:hypothetical protein ZHAS_00006721 [Anopheles sinensis]|uniref:Uncharacterized protein n=1 Tax=Anopheles sinensis TaxID=74873 RepID=A0A084VLW6_ANOSI|nr:hypothetical protein ZHAS_00006721 [Anopheles sinensis]